MVDLEWSTNTDWTNAQSTTNIDINSGTFELADAIPDSVTDQWRMDEGSGTAVANNIGTVDLSLNGATWASDAESVGGFRTEYDGADDAGISNSAFAINSIDITALVWFDVDTSSNEGFILSSAASTDSITPGTDDGWEISQTSNETIGFRVRENGSFTSILELDDAGTLQTGKRYMAAMAMSGDQADCYLFDNNGLIDSGSGSGARATGIDTELYTGSRPVDNDFNHDGSVDAPALARGAKMAQSEIDEYRSSTSP